MYLVLCVLALLLTTAVGTARGSCRCAAALIALAGVWLLANGPVEGPVLWAMDAQHGLTTADLLAIPYTGFGLRCLLRSREFRRYLAQRESATVVGTLVGSIVGSIAGAAVGPVVHSEPAGASVASRRH